MSAWASVISFVSFPLSPPYCPFGQFGFFLVFNEKLSSSFASEPESFSMRAVGGYNRQRSKLSDVFERSFRARPDSKFSDDRKTIMNFRTILRAV
jgi:hypothetical protein